NHNKFNPSQSSTFRNNGQTYTLSYDFGSLVVVLVFDTMTVQNIVTDNQEFGLNFDGILGMAYPSLAVGGTPTVMQSRLQQDQLTQPLFSFYFSRQPIYQYGESSSWKVWTPNSILVRSSGSLSPGKCTGSLLSRNKFAIGDQATGWCSQGCQAIVDMGTFLLAVSQQYMTSFLQSTGAQENKNGDNNSYCMLGIEASYLPSSSGEPLWILGNVFLKEYYSVFDVANN
ncbi:hypothetical protein E2I00_019725, partial [Balaenoptera physalus]